MSFSTLTGTTDPDDIPRELLEWETTNHPVFDTCIQGHIVAVQTFQAHTPDCVTFLDRQGRTLLMIAAECGHTAICRWLLEESSVSSDIEFRKRIDSKNRTTNDAATPLIVACRGGHLDTVQYLLHKGAKVNAEKLRNVTSLFIAAQSGHDDVVRCLLNAGANVDSFTSYHASPLYIAAQNGHVACAQILLDNGAHVNALREHNVSPLYVASQNGHFEMVKLLHERGGDPYIFRDRGIGPLYAASQGGYAKVVEFLVEHTRLDPNQAIPGTVCRPLTISCHYGHFDVVKVLVKKAHADVNYAENPRFSPFALALSNDNFSVAIFLRAYNADCTARTHQGLYELLGGAELQMDERIIAQFVEHTCDWSRLQCAALAREHELLRELLGKGMDPRGLSPDLRCITTSTAPLYPDVCDTTVKVVQESFQPWSFRTHELYGPEYRKAVEDVFLVSTEISVDSPYYLPRELWLKICSFFRRCDFYVAEEPEEVDCDPDTLNDAT